MSTVIVADLPKASLEPASPQPSSAGPNSPGEKRQYNDHSSDPIQSRQNGSAGLPDKDEITPLLNLAQNGNRAAESRLIELLYADLRRAACACLRFERPGHTLQPTALVHEVFGRLRGRSKPWNNRTHYIAAALETMRHVLVDYARKHSAQRRGSGAVRVDLEPRTAVSDPWTVLVLDVDRALTRLSTLDERLAAIVKLRYFGGFTDVEIGRILHLSDRTVMREWEVARAWLHGQLAGYRTERGPSRSKPNGGVQDL